MRQTRLAWRCFAAYWRAAPLLALLRFTTSVGAGAGPVLAAWLTKQLIDRLSGLPGPSYPVLLGGIGAVGTLVACTSYVARYAERELSRRVTFLVEDQLISAIARLDGIAALERPEVHNQLRLAQQGGPSAPTQLISALLTLVEALVLVGGFAATLVRTSPVTAGLIAATIVPSLIGQIRVSRERLTAAVESAPRRRRQLFFTTLLTDPRAAKEIRLFALARFLRGRLLDMLHLAQRSERRADLLALRTDSMLGALGSAIVICAIIAMVNSIRSGQATVGDLALVLAATASVQGVIATATAQLATVGQNLAMFQHYVAIADIKPDMPAPAATTKVPALATGVRFEGVWFRYDATHDWVLRGLNLHLPAASSIALVGRNGSGKSTVVKLLCRLYEPTRGRVTWDGTDIRELPVAELRRRISAVFQDFMTYDLTAAENVGIGAVDSVNDLARIHESAEWSGADRVIQALPGGYRTMLSRWFSDDSGSAMPGAVGVQLSGGQWQLVALARAGMRRDCDIVILDEPSAGLDAVAEYEVHRRFTLHRQGRASLLISHRLNTVRDADTIAVLDGGVIVEQGNHHELIASNGIYAQLFQLQSRGFQEPAQRYEESNR